MKGLNGKVSDLEKAASQRKAKLDENSAFLQFNWKADVVESWIGKRSLGAAGISFPPEQMIFFCGEETGGMWAYQRPSPLRYIRETSTLYINAFSVQLEQNTCICQG